MKIRPRRPKVDVSRAALHWVAGDAQTTHTVNVLSLLLPAGERYFVALFKEALPAIEDKGLRADVRGFIGQEAQHADAHQRVLDHFVAQGIDIAPYVANVEWIFEVPLAEAPFGVTLPRALAPGWLRRRVGLVAAIEHFTTMLGGWVLEAEPLAAASSSPEMMRLLEWHGAEEVEHRAVAFELYEALGGGYPGRLADMAIALTVLTGLWIEGVSFMMKKDPSSPGAPTFARFIARGREGVLPTFGAIGRAALRYVRPGHHPRDEHVPARTAAVLAMNEPLPVAAA